MSPKKFNALQGAIGVAVALGLAACVVDRVESRGHADARRERVRLVLANVRARLETELNERIQLAHGLGTLALLRPGITQAEFETVTRGMDSRIGGIRALQLAREGVVSHVHPEATNREALGHSLLNDPRTSASAAAALAMRQMRVAGPYKLRQGSEGLVARLPVFLANGQGAEFWGFAIVVVDFPDLLRRVGVANVTDVTIAMRGRDGQGALGEVFRGDEALFGPESVTTEVHFPNGHWQLAAQPLEGWGGSWPGRDWLVLLTALLMASLPPAVLAHGRARRAQVAVERLRLREKLLANLGEGVYGVDGDGRCTFINPAGLAILGWKREDVIGREVRRLFHDPAGPPPRTPGHGGEGDMLRRDGSRFPARMTFDAFDEGQGGAMAFSDMSASRAAADRLRLAASVFAHAQQGIMITDAGGDLIDVNPAFSQITGYTREEVLGRNPRLLSSGRQPPEFYASLKQSLEETGSWRGEIWNRHKSGQVYPELLHIVAVCTEGGRPGHFIGVFSDISRQKQHEAELTRIAHYDPLTGMPNRVLLTDRLAHAIASARAGGGRVALGMLDIDRFKDVNDRFGHGVGDRVLAEVARRLGLALRTGDTVARFGGDEFALLINPVNGVDDCEARAHRLIESLATPIVIDGRGIELSTSVGFTLFPDDPSNAEALVRHAAQAMFVAKQEGGRRYRLFDPEQDRQARIRREKLDHVARAIEQDELRLMYQPKVDMRLGRVVGCEALVRWQHPREGLLAPAAFLPVIAGTELDAALGRWVMRKAVAQLAAWKAEGLSLGVSVNVSASHLLANGFLSEVDAALAACPGVDPCNLEIEVLETMPFDDLGSATTILQGCLTRGLGVAIDDFGTGYSSLAYFKQLPVRTLKIDQMFIRDLLHSPEDRAIVEGIIRVARAFDLTIVAEGVESKEIGEALVAMDCHLGQGYGIAAPMTAEAIPRWVREWEYRASRVPPEPAGKAA